MLSSPLSLAQLRILQAVSGYAAEEEEEDGGGGEGGGGGTARRGALEAALVSKSRQLEHKLTGLRLELAEAKGGFRVGGEGGRGWAGDQHISAAC